MCSARSDCTESRCDWRKESSRLTGLSSGVRCADSVPAPAPEGAAESDSQRLSARGGAPWLLAGDGAAGTMFEAAARDGEACAGIAAVALLVLGRDDSVALREGAVAPSVGAGSLLSLRRVWRSALPELPPWSPPPSPPPLSSASSGLPSGSPSWAAARRVSKWPPSSLSPARPDTPLSSASLAALRWASKWRLSIWFSQMSIRAAVHGSCLAYGARDTGIEEDALDQSRGNEG